MKQRVLLACILCWEVLVIGAMPGSAQVSASAQSADSVIAPVPARVVIPVRLSMPEGGVRIRSVRGKQPLIIIRTPPLYSAPAPYAGVTAAPAGPRLPAVTGLTRTDLDLLETRLMFYLERRLAVIEQTQRELLASMRTSSIPGTAVLLSEEPAAPVLEEPLSIAAQTNTVVKKAVPDSSVPALAVADTAHTVSAPPIAAVKAAPVFTVPTVVEVERAILDTGLLRTVSIMFEFNKATLLPASSEILDVLGSVLTKYPEVRIEVAGYTDSSGPDEYNLHLSQLRAESVREYLVSTYSIDPGRLTARGFGESRPIADNNTPTGRAMNRRVEFVVVKTAAAAETK
jgi:outer membrane protein OmpA-like peptidoglycan-associated protein